jgi:hypothetical protein
MDAMTDEVKSGAPKDKMAGQMNEIDTRLKRIDGWLDSIAFTLNPKASPSLAGIVAGIADNLAKIEERLQRIEEKLGH